MLVDSKYEELSNEEIIQIATAETHSQYAPEQMVASVMAEAHSPNTLVIRQGNTLFILHRPDRQPHIGVFRALNADVAANYVENGIMFVKACKSMGFKAVVSQFRDPSIIHILKYVSRNPPFPGMGYEVKRTTNGGFQAVINLGSDNQGGLAQSEGFAQE
jgi:hypothetical protein